MKYNLFYAGYNMSDHVEQIGFTESEDLISWNKESSNPLVSVLEIEKYTEKQTSNPCVIFVDGIYKMWYQSKSSDDTFYIMYAESKNLEAWDFKREPVLTLGKGMGFRYGLQHPHVLYDEGKYKMWSTITDASGSNFAYFESQDGVDWNMKNKNVIHPEYTWEGNYVLYPMVIKEKGIYKMWYTGKDASSKYSIGYAESKDGVNWLKENKPVIQIFVFFKIIRKAFEFACKCIGYDFRIPLYGIGSPFVWKENKEYFLIGHEIGTHGKLYISLYQSVDGKSWKKIKNNILKSFTMDRWNSFFQGDPYIYVKQ